MTSWFGTYGPETWSGTASLIPTAASKYGLASGPAGRKAKGGWAKIHMLIDIDTRAILKGKITRAPPPTALP